MSHWKNHFTRFKQTILILVQHQWLTIGLLTAVYILVFLALATPSSFHVTAAVILPVLLIALLYGLKTAVWINIGSFFLNLSLYYLEVGHVPPPFSVGAVAGHTMTLVASIFAGHFHDINQKLNQQLQTRAAFEANLHHNRNTIQGILNSSLDGIMAFRTIRDAQGSIEDFEWILVNPHAEKIVQRYAKDLIGKRMLIEMPDNKEEGLYDIYVSVVETGVPALFEHHYHHDGIDNWFHIQAVKLDDGFVVSFSDITRRKLAELQLIESEKRYALVSQSMHDVLGLLNLRGDHFYLSPSVTERLGYQPEELVGVNPLDLLHPDDHAEAETRFKAAFRTLQPFTIECRFLKKDGSYVYLETAVSFALDEAGRPKHIQLLSRDISRQKEYERQLKESRQQAQRLALVAQKMHQGVTIIDTHSRVEWVNEGFTRITGFTLDEVKGKSLEHVLQSENTAAEIVHRIKQRIQDQKRFEAELVNHRKNGEEYWVRLEMQPLSAENDRITGFMVIQSDITERVRYEAALEAAKEAAENATRVKSDFLANMSHEIRTPLNAIIGLSSLLINTPLNAEQYDYVQTLRTSGDGLLTIINDILDFSKIEAERLELETIPFNLSDSIEEALDLVASSATVKGIELAYLIDPQVPPILLGDVTRVRQILVNLLSNAVKFTETGEVVVSVTHHAQDTDSQTIRISVIDTGIGIPQDRLSHLFQPFSQLDSSTTRKFGGTGLGLAIAKRLAEAMGGTLWAESEVGVGSTFSFTLKTAVPAETEVKIPTYDTHHLANKRVLVVDDHAINQLILKHHLSAWRITAHIAGSGQEAMALLEKGLLFDAGIIDLQMPDMDGVMVAKRLRQHTQMARKPLLMLSSLGRAQEADAEAFFNAYLHKPIKPGLLHEALTKLLAPAKTETEHTAVSSLPYDHLNQQSNLRILLAEDNVINQKVALRILERIGYQADIAANGVEVLAAMQRQIYDVILMDVQMPELDGVEATVQIRQSLPAAYQPRIIALTANAMTGDRERFLNAGMDDYISKPVRFEDLIAALAKCDPLAVT